MLVERSENLSTVSYFDFPSFIRLSRKKEALLCKMISPSSLVTSDQFLSNISSPSSTSSSFQKEMTESGLKVVYEPNQNDILMGRGGKNNQHVGNEQLREIARARCSAYQAASKKGKSIISRDIVRCVREMVPPGRCVSSRPSQFES